MVAKALTIAGSDSGGGAGIQADLKTFSALGVYGCSAITAVTAQNTCAVTSVVALEPEMVGAQIDAVLDDIEIDAIKIGMLFSPEIIRVVADRLRGYSGAVVLDPVMIAKSGDALLRDDAVDAMLELLVPVATLVTPNLPELARMARTDSDDPLEQARSLDARAVLIKGGHADHPVCTDVLLDRAETLRAYDAPRIDTANTHGTGCTLSAAIAAELAKGLALPDAVGKAHVYLHEAIRKADTLGVGKGHGPVHHFHAHWPADAR